MSCAIREPIPEATSTLRPTGTATQRWDRLNLPVLYFLSAWFVIGVISAYDAYLVKVVGPMILSFEQNPICSMLIHWDPHHLSYFFLAKGAGTVAVLVILLVLFAKKRSLALHVITGVAVFQLGLLAYLNLATG